MLYLFSFLSQSWALQVPENSKINQSDRLWRLEPTLEIGFLAPLSHKIKFGKEGTDFDYIADGGQDNLFRYTRWEMNFRGHNKHNLRLLFQPFDVTTTQIAKEDLTFDYVVFPENTPMFFRYGFDYYRGSYTYDIFQEEDRELGLGCSLQIRNAAIEFRSQDGTLQNSNRDIGPVPLLKIHGRFAQENNRWWGFEADGAYAPIKYINGDSSDVIGALLDASVRGGLILNDGTEAYLNVRYIGGGAEGTEKESSREPGKDGYVENWIHLMSVSVGLQFR